jgi:hypothetical protein
MVSAISHSLHCTWLAHPRDCPAFEWTFSRDNFGPDFTWNFPNFCCKTRELADYSSGLGLPGDRQPDPSFRHSGTAAQWHGMVSGTVLYSTVTAPSTTLRIPTLCIPLWQRVRIRRGLNCAALGNLGRPGLMPLVQMLSQFIHSLFVKLRRRKSCESQG